MRRGPFLFGLACILVGMAIPMFVRFVIYSSFRMRMRLDAMLADPTLVTGVGWPFWGAFALSVALFIGGGVLVFRSFRRVPADRA